MAQGGAIRDDAPTDEVKADQKAFFRLLYQLLVDAERHVKRQAAARLKHEEYPTLCI